MSIGVLLLGATLALHVDEARGLSEQDRGAVLGQAVKALNKASGLQTVIDDAKPGGCAKGDPCLAAIVERTKASEVVMVRMVGAPSKIRFGATRLAADGKRIASANGDLARGGEGWDTALDGLAKVLYPTPVDSPTPPIPLGAVTPEPPPRETPEIAPTPVPPLASATPPPAPEPATLPAPAPPPPAPPAQKEELAKVDFGASAPAPVAEESGGRRGPKPATWALLAGAAAASGVGIAFGVSSANARSEGTSVPHSASEVEALQDRTTSHAIVADVFFGTALAAAVTGVILWIGD